MSAGKGDKPRHDPKTYGKGFLEVDWQREKKVETKVDNKSLKPVTSPNDTTRK